MNSDMHTGQVDNGGAERAPQVGALLRASRLRVGEDLRDIADILCVRYPYLEAIEDCRYGDLPGETYAIGFIRSYAEHLGLDGEEVVRRFRAEQAGNLRANDLSFPTPVPDSGVPKGAIVLIGAVFALLIYGGWYATTTDDGLLSDLISPVPEHMRHLISGDDAPADAGTPPAVDPTEASAGPTEDQGAAPQAPIETATAPVETAAETVAETAAAPVETAAETSPTPAADGSADAATETAATAATETAAAAVQQPAESVPETVRDSVSEPAVSAPVPTGDAPAVDGATAVAETAVETNAEATVSAVEGAARPEGTAPDDVAAQGTAPDNVAAQGTAARAPTMTPPAETTGGDGAAPASETADAPPDGAPSDVATSVDVDSGAAASQVSETGEIATAPAAETVSAEELNAQSLQAATGTNVEAAPAPPGPTGEPGGADAPATPPQTGAASGIVIFATDSSWVEVRNSSNGNVVFTGLMSAGARIDVPDEGPLLLDTGNAGALDIRVDGVSVPKLGGVGAVRKGVALDAERLKAGTAAN